MATVYIYPTETPTAVTLDDRTVFLDFNGVRLCFKGVEALEEFARFTSAAAAGLRDLPKCPECGVPLSHAERYGHAPGRPCHDRMLLEESKSADVAGSHICRTATNVEGGR